MKLFITKSISFLPNCLLLALHPDGKETLCMLINDVDTQNADNVNRELMSEDDVPFVCNKQENNASLHEWGNLQPNELKSYCNPGNKFFGIKCAGCPKYFVSKVTDEKTQFKPSARNQMHCCANVKDDCTFALCNDCYKLRVPK